MKHIFLLRGYPNLSPQKIIADLEQTENPNTCSRRLLLLLTGDGPTRNIFLEQH